MGRSDPPPDRQIDGSRRAPLCSPGLPPSDSEATRRISGGRARLERAGSTSWKNGDNGAAGEVELGVGVIAEGEGTIELSVDEGSYQARLWPDDEDFIAQPGGVALSGALWVE